MIGETVRFILTSLVGSICFLGCYKITGYVVEPRQFMVMGPHIMLKHPWIGKATGPLSFFVLLLVILNGWLIWHWTGLVSLPLFWFVVSNPLATRSTILNDPLDNPAIRNSPELWETIESRSASKVFMSNPFVHVVVGLPVLVLLTIINAVVS